MKLPDFGNGSLADFRGTGSPVAELPGRGETAAAPSLTWPGDGNWAGDMLDDLDRAHAHLIDSLTAMGEATSRAQPDPTGYPAARWRLSNASRLRRVLTARIISKLLTRVDARAAADLKRLQAEDALLIGRSAAHISRWTMQSIADDWVGYCRASAQICRSMRQRVAAEQAILYPVLRSLSAVQRRRT